MSPVYEYICECGMEWESYNTVENRDGETCDCGKHANRKMSVTAKPVVYEYYNRGLGKMVTGPKQKSKLMKELGVEESNAAND